MVASGEPVGVSARRAVAAVRTASAQTAAPPNTNRENDLFMGCSFGRDGPCGCCSSSFCHVLIVFRALATDADSSDYFSIEDDRNSALQRSCSGQRERGNS